MLSCKEGGTTDSESSTSIDCASWSFFLTGRKSWFSKDALECKLMHLPLPPGAQLCMSWPLRLPKQLLFDRVAFLLYF